MQALCLLQMYLSFCSRLILEVAWSIVTKHEVFGGDPDLQM